MQNIILPTITEVCNNLLDPQSQPTALAFFVNIANKHYTNNHYFVIAARAQYHYRCRQIAEAFKEFMRSIPITSSTLVTEDNIIGQAFYFLVYANCICSILTSNNEEVGKILASQQESCIILRNEYYEKAATLIKRIHCNAPQHLLQEICQYYQISLTNNPCEVAMWLQLADFQLRLRHIEKALDAYLQAFHHADSRYLIDSILENLHKLLADTTLSSSQQKILYRTLATIYFDGGYNFPANQQSALVYYHRLIDDVDDLVQTRLGLLLESTQPEASSQHYLRAALLFTDNDDGSVLAATRLKSLAKAATAHHENYTALACLFLYYQSKYHLSESHALQRICKLTGTTAMTITTELNTSIEIIKNCPWYQAWQAHIPENRSGTTPFKFELFCNIDPPLLNNRSRIIQPPAPSSSNILST